MNSSVVQIHKTEQRDNYNSRLGIIFDGDDNLRSLIVQNIIKGSPTATQCANMLHSFLKGAGFEDNHKHINLSPIPFVKERLNNMLSKVCYSVSRQKGAFIHVQYNAAYEKISYKVIPFTRCRLGKKDSEEYNAKIVVSKSGWSSYVKPEDRLIYDVYNPTPSAIQAQVDAVGGWHNYKGQIYYLNLEDSRNYPQSPIESAYLSADSEYRLGTYYNSTVRRGFKDVIIARHKAFPDEETERKFDENLKSCYGAENGGSIMKIEDDWDQDGRKDNNLMFDQLKSNVDVKQYEHLSESFANDIRKGFYNIPTQLLEATSGKLGNTTGEDLKMWTSIYNTYTADARELIEDAFKELLSNYKNPINTEGLNIVQYSLLPDGTTENHGTTNQ